MRHYRIRIKRPWGDNEVEHLRGDEAAGERVAEILRDRLVASVCAVPISEAQFVRATRAD